MKIQTLNESNNFSWFGKYFDRKGNKKFIYITKDITRDAQEASEILEDRIPEPFTKFVFCGTISTDMAKEHGAQLVDESWQPVECDEETGEYFSRPGNEFDGIDPQTQNLEEEAPIKNIYYHDDLGGIKRGHWLNVKDKDNRTYAKWNFEPDEEDNWTDVTDSIKELPYHNFVGERPAKMFSFGGWRHWMDDEVDKFYVIEGNRIDNDFEVPGMPRPQRESIEKPDYQLFYDRHLRLWTVYLIDAEGNQISDTEYASNRKDAIDLTRDSNNFRLRESLDEALSPKEGNRVQMDYYAKPNNGQKGTCTGRIGELCFITWDDGTKSKEIKGYLKVIDDANESMNEALGRDYSHIPEVKQINYSNNKHGNLLPYLDCNAFKAALEEVGLEAFKIKSARLKGVSKADLKDEFGGNGMAPWKWINDFDSSVPIGQGNEFHIFFKGKFPKVEEKLEVDEEEKLTEDFDAKLDEDVEVPTLEGPNEGAEYGLSELLNSAIQHELETVNEYNVLALNARAEGFDDLASVIDEINTEENKHIGQLQELLKLVSPNAQAIVAGETEASDDLVQVDNNLE